MIWFPRGTRFRVLTFHLHKPLRGLHLIAHQLGVIDIDTLKVLGGLALLHEHLLPALGDGSLMLQQMHESIHGFGRAQRFYAVRIIRGCAGAITGRQTVCHRKVVVSCPPQWGMMRAWRAGAARWNAHAPR